MGVQVPPSAPTISTTLDAHRCSTPRSNPGLLLFKAWRPVIHGLTFGQHRLGFTIRFVRAQNFRSGPVKGRQQRVLRPFLNFAQMSKSDCARGPV
jgi:hypothetical protein